MSHSKRFAAIKEKVADKFYAPREAIDMLKEFGKTTKFDQSLEFHVKLGVDATKSEQMVRGVVTFRHQVGPSAKVAAIVSPGSVEKAKAAGADIVGGEDLIKEISETEKTDFDVVVAEVAMMPKIGRIAKILGPRGLMPSPKNETVGPDVTPLIKGLKAGKVSFRMDEGGNIHQKLGKLSLATDDLLANLRDFVSMLENLRPETAKGVFIPKPMLTSTMGPAIKIDLKQINK